MTKGQPGQTGNSGRSGVVIFAHLSLTPVRETLVDFFFVCVRGGGEKREEKNSIEVSLLDVFCT